MTSAAIARGIRRRRAATPFQRAVVTGLAFGIMAVYLAMVGLLPMIHARAVIVDVLTMAQAALLAIGLGAGAYIARREQAQPSPTLLLHGLITGAITGATLAVLVLAMNVIDLRSIFLSL